jgi:hypothetical protein
LVRVALAPDRVEFLAKRCISKASHFTFRDVTNQPMTNMSLHETEEVIGEYSESPDDARTSFVVTTKALRIEQQGGEMVLDYTAILSVHVEEQEGRAAREANTLSVHLENGDTTLIRFGASSEGMQDVWLFERFIRRMIDEMARAEARA